MAVALAGFFTQIHHISADCFWGNWDFCEVLLIVAEVHREKHLETNRNTTVIKTFHTADGHFVHLHFLPQTVSVKCKRSAKQYGRPLAQVGAGTRSSAEGTLPPPGAETGVQSDQFTLKVKLNL